MRSCFYLFAIIGLTACQAQPGNPTAQRAANLPADPQVFQREYEGQKAAILKKQETHTITTVAKAQDYLFHAIIDSLAPYWYGTPWDFNGITQQPRQGNIACGYFVTTLLRDAGLPVERVRLSQAASSVMINELCTGIKRYSRFSDLTASLDQLPDHSILLLGLDNHVGIITREAGKSWFLHASYVGAVAVEKQLIEEATPVTGSKTYMLGNLLGNEVLVKQWMGR